MSWRIRHEGSPKSIDGLTFAQVVEGLQDGQWALTDEVMGPTDRDWQAIDTHPDLEEVAAEVQPPPHLQEDETRLDMNPLIDVCLVLLIFFILTMSYGALEKILEAAQVTGGATPQLSIRSGDVEQSMIRAQIVQQNARTTINVRSGGETKMDVPLDKLVETLQAMPHEGKTAMLIEFSYNVPHGVVIAVQDAAKALKIEKVYYVAQKK
jgi:biopolymer transport protein ExbD